MDLNIWGDFQFCISVPLNELKEIVTSSHDAGLGEIDRAEICQELSKLTERKWKPQSKYSDKDRLDIRLQSTLKIMVHQKQQSFQQKMSPLCEHLSRSMMKT